MAKNKPVGPLHYLPGGQMREFEDGWHCTCGGKPGAECDHIREIWRILGLSKTGKILPKREAKPTPPGDSQSASE